jgi:hypothetical protein
MQITTPVTLCEKQTVFSDLWSFLPSKNGRPGRNLTDDNVLVRPCGWRVKSPPGANRRGQWTAGPVDRRVVRTAE